MIELPNEPVNDVAQGDVVQAPKGNIDAILSRAVKTVIERQRDLSPKRTDTPSPKKARPTKKPSTAAATSANGVSPKRKPPVQRTIEELETAAKNAKAKARNLSLGLKKLEDEQEKALKAAHASKNYENLERAEELVVSAKRVYKASPEYKEFIRITAAIHEAQQQKAKAMAVYESSKNLAFRRQHKEELKKDSSAAAESD